MTRATGRESLRGVAKTLITILFACVYSQASPAQQMQPARPRLTVELQPRTVYVGQVAMLTVIVDEAEGEAHVATPRIEGADVAALGEKRVIGTGVHRILTSFQVMARKPGMLTIPSIEVRVGGWRGSSTAARLKVSSLPASGRPASFLGGVGAFELKTGVDRPAVVVGEWVEYQVEVSGPGSVGISQGPDVTNLEKLPSRFEIDRQPDRVEVDPPSRCFVFRLRPLRAGSVTLPPIPIAGFDLETKRYLTRVAPSVKLRVEPLPALESASLEYGQRDSRTGDSPVLSRELLILLGLVTGTVALVGSGLVIRQSRTSQRSRFDAAIEGVVRALSLPADPAEHARTLTEGLAAYLNLAIERPKGALTPDEAALGVLEATRSETLAEQARDLIALCDRARFGTPFLGMDSLREQGLGFLHGLPRRSIAHGQAAAFEKQ
jgi:hypothetical protein